VGKIVRIVLDESRCAGRGICHYEAPDVYQLDERGFCTIRELQVPVHQEESAEMGAHACPEQAILLD